MTEGRILDGVVIDETARVVHCKSCGQPIWWGLTASGKRNPFDVVGRERTAITHFSTCPQARQWTRR